MERFLFGQQKKKTPVSRTQRFTFFSRFCIMPWKDEREPRMTYCVGKQVDVVQEFTTLQNFGRN